MIIREYQLKPGDNSLLMPDHVDILGAAVSHSGAITLFASSEPGADHDTERKFAVARTGETVTGTFIATVKLGDAPAHVFEV